MRTTLISTSFVSHSFTGEAQVKENEEISKEEQ